MRVSIADYCESVHAEDSLTIGTAVREYLGRYAPRFSCTEHLEWLEQQVHYELRWRALQRHSKVPVLAMAAA